MGKDVIAHAMHDLSGRAAGPLAVFDCGAVAANLVESELLGHERGAFTGAISATRGRSKEPTGERYSWMRLRSCLSICSRDSFALSRVVRCAALVGEWIVTSMFA